MRPSVALIALLLASCGKQLPSLDAEFRGARRLLYSEKYDLALSKAQAGLRRASGAMELWRFRLLRAEVLLGQRRSKEAGAEVAGYGQPPAGPQWAEIRGQLLQVQGRVLYAQRRYSEATDAFDQAAEIARNSNLTTLAAEIRLRQGLLKIHDGRLDEARVLFQALVETASKLRDPYLQANAAGNVGFVLQEQRRYEDAIPWFEKVITLFAGLGAAESVARNHGNLATCYWGLGDYDNARLHYQIAQDGFAKNGNPDSQQIWIGNASNIPYELGDYPTAEKGYLQALEIARKVPNQRKVGLWLANLAATSVELGKWDAAGGYNAEALPVLQSADDHQWDQMLKVNAARVAEGKGHFEEAQDLFRSVLKADAEDPSSVLDAHAGLARLAARGGHASQADLEFRNTLSMIEKSRTNLVKDDYKVSYLASLIRFHREYVEFLIASHQPEKALAIADASRARLLEEKGVAAFRAADYRRIAKQMNATLFEYLLGPKKSYLWVVTAGGVQLHELPARDELRTLIESYRAVVTSGRNPLDVAADTGRHLYEILLAPGVQSPGRFVIVPDQDLYSFNLETLPKPGEPGKFWIEDATVGIAPSLNYLAGRAATHPGRALLAIGDAAGSGTQYPKLEFAGQEIDSIAARISDAGNTILRGDAANPASYSSSHPERFGYIHFAAHAAANQQSPLDSAVILSGPPEKSRLLAREVMAIPLTAELVTISACRSAGGKTYAGEGLVGFAWAFLRAGAHNVIAGLWDVSDRSTARLMTGLYGEIAAGKSAPEALRTAKLQLIHAGGSYAKPFYWAPFQVYVGTAQ